MRSKIAVLLALMIVLAACSGSPAPTVTPPTDAPTGAPPTDAPTGPPPTDQPTDAPEPTPAPEAVTLTVWIFEGEETFLPTLKAAYSAVAPHVTLEVTEFPEDDYTLQIDSSFLANQPPDIAFVFAPRWLQEGRFVSIADAVAEAGIDLSTYNPASLDAHQCLQDGEIYCLGSYQGAVLLFYNKDMFDAAELDYPSATEPMTIDEYAALVEALAQPGASPTETIWGGSAPGAYWWVDQRILFSDDGRTIEGVANDASTVHTFEVFGNLIANGWAPGSGFLEGAGLWNSAADLFAQGQQAMVITENFSVEMIEAAEINYGVAPVPVEAGGQPWASSWTDAFGVTAQGDHIEEATKFIVFLGGHEGNALRARQGTLPLDSAVAEELTWAQGIPGREELLQAVGAARIGLFIPDYWDVVLPELEDVLSTIVEEDVGAQQALDAIAPAMQRKLDEAWETWDLITGN